MNRNEIKERIIKVIKDNLPDFRDVDIKENTTINQSQGLDSMTFIYIICKIEAEFKIKVKENRWNKMSTLRDIVDEVCLQLAK